MMMGINDEVELRHCYLVSTTMPQVWIRIPLGGDFRSKRRILFPSIRKAVLVSSASTRVPEIDLSSQLSMWDVFIESLQGKVLLQWILSTRVKLVAKLNSVPIFWRFAIVRIDTPNGGKLRLKACENGPLFLQDKHALGRISTGTVG